MIHELSGNPSFFGYTNIRSPSQTTDEFYLFMVNLETLLADISNGTPHFVLITGDFNAKFRNWSTNDTANAEGAYLDFLMTLYGLNKLITKPTSILEHLLSTQSAMT